MTLALSDLSPSVAKLEQGFLLFSPLKRIQEAQILAQQLIWLKARNPALELSKSEEMALLGARLQNILILSDLSILVSQLEQSSSSIGPKTSLSKARDLAKQMTSIEQGNTALDSLKCAEMATLISRVQDVMIQAKRDFNMSVLKASGVRLLSS
jgi:hypothetical protein